MLTSPEKNIKFTDLDKERIKKVDARIDNIINEIDIHTKTLRSLVIETKAEEDKKEYLISQIKEIEKNKENLISENSELESNIKKLKKDLSEGESKLKVMDEYLYKKENDLKDRESTLNQLESNHAKRVSDFENESKKLESKKALVAKTQNILKEAIDSIKW